MFLPKYLRPREPSSATTTPAILATSVAAAKTSVSHLWRWTGASNPTDPASPSTVTAITTEPSLCLPRHRNCFGKNDLWPSSSGSKVTIWPDLARPSSRQSVKASLQNNSSNRGDRLVLSCKATRESSSLYLQIREPSLALISSSPGKTRFASTYSYYKCVCNWQQIQNAIPLCNLCH